MRKKTLKTDKKYKIRKASKVELFSSYVINLLKN